MTDETGDHGYDLDDTTTAGMKATLLTQDAADGSSASAPPIPSQSTILPAYVDGKGANTHR